MKDDNVLNVVPPDGKKLAARKVLFITWLVLCAAWFVCIVGVSIYSVINYVEQYDSSYAFFQEAGFNWEEYNITVLLSVSLSLIMHLFLFATATALIAPQIISAFRPLSARHTTDYSLAKKILLIVWAVIYLTAVITLIVNAIQNIIESVTLAVTLQTDTTNLIVQYSVQLFINVVLYLPLAVLFIPKVKAAFLPRKKEDNI